MSWPDNDIMGGDDLGPEIIPVRVYLNRPGNLQQILEFNNRPNNLIITVDPDDGFGTWESMDFCGVWDGEFFMFSSKFLTVFSPTFETCRQVANMGRDIPGSPVPGQAYTASGYRNSAETVQTVIYDVKNNRILQDSDMVDDRDYCGIHAPFSFLITNICEQISVANTGDDEIPDDN